MTTRTATTRRGLTAGLWLIALLLAVPIAGALGHARTASAQDPPAAIQIVAGQQHTCALRADQSVTCWGDDSLGQEDIPAGYSFTQLGAGAQFTCGLTPGGTIVCWGVDPAGTGRHTFTEPGGPYKTLAVGGYEICGLQRSDSTPRCWGSNVWGAMSQLPPWQGVPMSYLVGGMFDICGIRQATGTALCWGGPNDFGQVSATPTAEVFTHLAASYHATCGLRPDQTVTCWGNVGAPPDPAATFTAISAGWDGAADYACGIRTAGDIVCWGGGPTAASPPTGTFTSISTGTGHACGIRTDASAQCWGVNTFGQVSPQVMPTSITSPAGQVISTGVHIQGSDNTGAPSPGTLTGATWSYAGVLPTDLSFTGQGVFTGSPRKAGHFPVTVTADTPIRVSGAVSVVITPGPLAYAIVTAPATATENDTIHPTAEGFDTYGNSLGDMTSSAVWSSSVATDAVAGNAITFPWTAATLTNSRDRMVTAELGSVKGQAGVSVRPAAASIAIGLSDDTPSQGDTIRVTVTAFDASGVALGDVSGYSTLTSDVGSDVVDAETVTFTHASPHTLSARYGNLRASRLVEVAALVIPPTPPPSSPPTSAPPSSPTPTSPPMPTSSPTPAPAPMQPTTTAQPTTATSAPKTPPSAPQPTRSNVLPGSGASTTPSPPPGTTGDGQGGGGHASAVTGTMASVQQVTNDVIQHPERLAAQVGVALVWILLLVFVVHTLGETLRQRYPNWSQAAAHRHPGVAGFLHGFAGLINGSGTLPLVLSTLLGGLIMWFVEPVGQSPTVALRVLGSALLSVLTINLGTRVLAVALGRALWKVRARPYASGWGLAVGLLGLGLSRVLQFVPGLLEASTLSLRETGDAGRHAMVRVESLRGWLQMGIALAAWAGVSAVPGHGTWPVVMAHDALVLVAVGGIFGLMTDLLPLSALLGGKLWRDARGTWVALTLVCATAFAVIVVPHPSNWIEVEGVRRWIMVASVAAAAAIIIILVLNLRARREQVSRRDAGVSPVDGGPSAAEGGSPPTEDGVPPASSGVSSARTTTPTGEGGASATDAGESPTDDVADGT